MKNTVSFLLICSPILLFAQVVDSVALKKVDSLIVVSRELTRKGDFEQALEVNASAEKLTLEKFDKASAAYGNVCFNYGRVFLNKGELQAAEKYMLEAKTIREKVLGKENDDYAWSLNNLGILYRDMGQYEKAEQYHLEAKDIRERVLGKNTIDYAHSLNNLAILYRDMGDYEKAEPLYLETKAIRGSILGYEHPDYAWSLNNLANFYWRIGNYEKAMQYHLEAKSIREKVLGKSHPDYAASLNNLGILYRDLGDYESAEPYYIEALAIWGKVKGKEHPNYVDAQGNLAVLYWKMGNYEKAENLFLENIAIREKTQGKQHPAYAISLNNLANLYTAYRAFNKAEPLYIEAKNILENSKVKETPEYALSLLALADLYTDMSLFEKAEPLYLESKIVLEKIFGTVHPEYASCLGNMANMYKSIGNFAKADSMATEAMAIRQKVLGRQHPDYVSSITFLANLYWEIGRIDKAEPLFHEMDSLNKLILLKAVRHLSEQELNSYLASFSLYQNLSLSISQSSSTAVQIQEDCYDNTLLHKGFLLNAVSQVAKLALSDPTTTEQYNQLKSYQRRLAAEYTKPIAERKNVAELEEKANTLEKGLTRSVAGFGEALRQVTWQEVQQKLQPGEAAIEFVHYKFVNPKPTDSTMYSALVLLPDGNPPKFIQLFEEKQLVALLRPEGKPKADFVNGLYANSTLYELLWRPLERMLSDAQTVYFSPSGLLHRLNIGAVPMPPMLRGEQAAGNLADRYRLIELGSTRQLVVPSNTNYNNKEALLYGGINYDMDSTAIASAISSLDANPLATRRGLDFSTAVSHFRGSGGRGGKWGYLRWTDVEVSSTQDILVDAGLHATIRKGYDGTEESFKEISVNGPSPQVLHLATHGFFFPDPVAVGSQQSAVESQGEAAFRISEHPMIRSGLVLAGGNYAWQTGKPFRPDREDGILTAYEISQMNLSNTELVVLSACETGLGDIQGNEGVYGLQRAFKIAGAKYLIMSLWQVPDFQTQELMSSFYSLWLEDKMTIPDAFRAAQKLMKDKYKSPFLWAGFVLVE